MFFDCGGNICYFVNFIDNIFWLKFGIDGFIKIKILKLILFEKFGCIIIELVNLSVYEFIYFISVYLIFFMWFVNFLCNLLYGNKIIKVEFYKGGYFFYFIFFGY